MKNNPSTYLFKYENNACVSSEFLFDAHKFVFEKNMPISLEWVGFCLMTADQQLFLSRWLPEPDGSCSNFEFTGEFDKNTVMIDKNGGLFLPLMTSFKAEMGITAVYKDRSDNFFWWSIDLVVNKDKSKQKILDSKKPIKNTNQSCRSFPWENELSKDNNFMGKSYSEAKKYLTSKYGCLITFDVLLAMARVYRGVAFNLIVYDVVSKANQASQLEDLMKSKILDSTAQLVVKQAHKALSMGKTFEVPFKSFLPYMENCDYLGILMILEQTQYLISEIKAAYEDNPYNPYPVSSEMPLMQLMVISSELVKSKSFIANKQHADFIIDLNKFCQPESFYRNKYGINMAKLQLISSMSKKILETLEYDFAVKAGLYTGEILTIREKRKLLSEKKEELENLMLERDRLENSVTSEGGLRQTEVKLNNHKAKLAKYTSAFANGKMSASEWDTKSSKLNQKIAELELIITEGKTLNFEKAKQARVDVSNKIRFAKQSYEALVKEVDALPKLQNLSVEFRTFFMLSKHVGF